jgi:hypothetical protein
MTALRRFISILLKHEQIILLMEENVILFAIPVPVNDLQAENSMKDFHLST